MPCEKRGRQRRMRATAQAPRIIDCLTVSTRDIRTIDRVAPFAQTARMPRYNSLLGKRLEVHYRAGELYLMAAGTLAQDSGKSIFLEDRFSQRGKAKTLRLEIPYQCIIRISEGEVTSRSPRTP